MPFHLDKTKLQSEEFMLILKKNRVKKISLFGSYAVGRECETSDIDFLVDFEDAADLLDVVGLKLALEEYFGRNVDVVTTEALSKYIRPKVLREAIPLHG